MKKAIGKMDIGLLVLMIIFAGFGLLMIFSASSVAAVLRYQTTSSYFFIKQLVAISFVFILGFLFIIRIPTSFYKYLTNIAVVFVLLTLILIFSYGIISNGAQSWYDFGKFDFQPAELAKSVLIIYTGVYYYKVTKTPSQNLFRLIIPLIIAVFMAFLIARQPDFGGAIMIFGLAFFMFMATPMSTKLKRNIYYLIFGFGVVIIFSVLLFGNNILGEKQLNRLNFQRPCSRYQEDSGYQVCNSYIAINNGSLFGVGLGNSTQKYLYLPEAHTDFIFPIIVEELGLVTGLIVLIGYAILLSRLLIIAKRANNLRNSIIAYGIFFLFTSHLLINLMGILGLIPLTGVPLPFLSYGGSFNINIIALLFIAQRISIENNVAQTKKELKNL